MRQLKKLWRRTAALACSFALLMGSSLQTVPMTVFSEETLTVEGETSDSDYSSTVDDGNSDATQMVITLTGQVQDTNGETVSGAMVQLGTLDENDFFIQDAAVDPVSVENGTFSVDISEDKLNTSCTTFHFYDKTGAYVPWNEPIDVNDSYAQKEIIYIPKAENIVSFSFESTQVTVSVYNSDSEEYETVNLATVNYNDSVQFKIEATDKYYKVDNVTTADGTSISPTSEEDVYVIENIQKNTEVQISSSELGDPVLSVKPEKNDGVWVQENKVDITNVTLPTSDASAELFYLFSESEISNITYESLGVEENYVGKGIDANELNALLAKSPIIKNGWAYLCIKDSNGLFSDVASVQFTNIDKTDPVVTIDAVSIVNDNSADDVMATVNVTASDSDSGSGVDGIYYKINDNDEGIRIENNSFKIKESNLDKIKVYVIDKAGNKSSTVSYSAENIFTLKVSYDDASWKQSKKVTVETNDEEAKITWKDPNVSFDEENNVFLVENQNAYTVIAINATSSVSCTFEIKKIDTVKPKLTKLDVPTEWKSNEDGNYSIEVEFDDEKGKNNGSGIRKIYYYFAGVEEKVDKETTRWKCISIDPVGQIADESIPVSSKNFNGKCYVYAVDEAGNESEPECSAEDIKIDSNAPTIDSVQYTSDVVDSLSDSKGFIKEISNTLSFGLLYRDYVTISIKAHDDESGIKTLQWYFAKDLDCDVATIPEGDWHRWSDISGFSTDERQVDIYLTTQELGGSAKGKFYVRAKDEVKWSDYVEINTAPERVEYDKTTDGILYTIIDNKKPQEPDLDTGSYDKTGTAENPKWTKQNVTIKVSGGETLSGVHHYEYKIEEDGSWITMKNDSKNSTITQDTITIKEDTNATYYFRAVSNTGVEGDPASILITVQKTPPKNVEVSRPDSNGKNGWYNHKGIPTFTFTEAQKLSEKSASVKAYYSLWNTQAGETEPADGTELTENQYPVISGDGVYQLKVWTKDEAGNICKDIYQEEFKVDTTAPELKDLYLTTADVDGTVGILAQDQSSVVYRYIYQNAVNIQTSFNCDISGLSEIKYQFTSSFAYDNAKWKTYQAEKGITVDPNNKFILAVYAMDQAGNPTIVYSDGIIVDNKAPVGESLAPEITLTPDSPNANGYHNGDVGVAISVQDPPYENAAYNPNGIYSGLSSVLYRVITDGVITQEETLFQAGEDPTDADLQSSFSTSIVVSSALNNSNNVIVEVVAVDRAGNERITQTGEGTIQIDTTAPTIRISYDNNSPDSSNVTYFKETRTATIEVTERNFNPDDVRLTLTNTDGTIPTISGWSVSGGSGNGDDTVYTATLTYSADGDYTFDIAYTDMADNPCTEINYVSGTAAPQEFTIDRTVPVINVSYDNNSASNSKYFSKARVATVVINEHNFDSSRVKITATASKEGKSITIPSSNISWSGSGDNHTATINYKEDGDYTFDIQFTDMAGNESEDANYGSSVAGKDFVVDTTIEKPTVTLNDKDGNGESFKDDLKLAISFGDINYDSYEVKLLRTRKGIKNEDVTSKFIKNLTVNGSYGEGVFDTFQKTQENDGIYTLTVMMKDKAGNTETTEVKFTVNRFGSVYEYSDYLTELIADGGSYVQALDDDLMITEYNADRLVKDSLEIVITKDGKPIDDADCQVTPVINDQVSTGSSGWYQYNYTISKDNFADDGVYKMVVSSKDEAGNTPENANYEDQSILFRVDSTAPELTSVTGLEEAVINAQAVSVGYDVYDTIGLKSVTIYVDGIEVDEITDFTADANNYDGTFDMNESKKAQSVRFVVEDRAGNITDTDAEGFTSAYPFKRAVTISTNLFVRWYANQLLFWGSIGGIAVVGIGIGFLIFFLKKKKISEPVGNVK